MRKPISWRMNLVYCRALSFLIAGEWMCCAAVGTPYDNFMLSVTRLTIFSLPSLPLPFT